jgi:mRNA interferase RelE/StbE
MKYIVEYTVKADKMLRKMNKSVADMIISWIEKNLVNTRNPRQHGKALVGDLAGYWRYRIGDYRLICEIQDKRLIICVILAGHRSKIYE